MKRTATRRGGVEEDETRSWLLSELGGGEVDTRRGTCGAYECCGMDVEGGTCGAGSKGGGLGMVDGGVVAAAVMVVVVVVVVRVRIVCSVWNGKWRSDVTYTRGMVVIRGTMIIRISLQKVRATWYFKMRAVQYHPSHPSRSHPFQLQTKKAVKDRRCPFLKYG